MADLSFTLATGLHERARPLAEGRVKVEGIDLTTVMLQDNGGRHARFLAGEFDSCELSFAVYLACWARQAPFQAIPVFFNRQFRHSAIYVNKRAGIRQPKDLEGRRVGIHAWLNSAALWARGVLQQEYGVDPRRVKWLAGSGPDVEDFVLPSGVEVTLLPAGATLGELLRAGELDALITPRTPSRDFPEEVGRLFPAFADVEADYYRRTGVFPVSHALVVRRQLLEQHPWLAARLFDACQAAKELAHDYAEDPEHSTLAWFGAQAEREAALFGPDRWPYGIEANRRTLEALVTYAHQSGLLPEVPPVEDLFWAPTKRV